MEATHSVQNISDVEMSSQGEDFRLYLQAELVRRIKQSPQYSLRSFARYFEMDPSLLSKILRGKRKISRSLRVKMVERLGLDPETAQRFLVDSKTGRGGRVFRELSLDHFHVIADWYHYAIFELAGVKGFQNNTRWIAQSLGISQAEAAQAVERLQRLHLIMIDEDGTWRRVNDNITTTGNQFTAAAFRTLQRQVLEGAQRALEQVPMEERDQTSMTMAIDKNLLPEAKEIIRRFRRELCDLLQKGRECNEVYQLSVSFYPLTQLTQSTQSIPKEMLQ